MKRMALWIVLGVAVCAGCAETATVTAADKPAAKPVRGELKAVMVAEGPAIDGTLNSPLWQKCPLIELGLATKDKPAPVRTTARVLFDPTHLYLAVDCEEPDTDGILKLVEKRDGPVYTDDSIEFFITGDPRATYYQFGFNALGTIMDGKFKAGGHMDRSWNGNLEVKTSIEKGKRWILTAKFPLKELSAYVGKDQVWPMNINRNRRGNKTRGKSISMAWAVMAKTDWHAVNDYGTVDGVDVPKRADGVTRTVAPMPRPPKYLRGEKAGDVTVYLKIDKLDIPDKGKGTQKHIDLPLKGSKNLKLAFVGRGTNGVKSVPLNVFDARARDNTTPVCYYWVDETWRPILYRFSEFRYNAVIESRVAPATDFRSIYFHGNKTGGKGVLSLRNVVVYRGDDRTPPEAPAKVKAAATKDGVKVTWDAAADNAGVASYVVSMAGADGKFAAVGKVSGTAFDHVLPPAKTAYRCRYRVRAVDFEENVSAWSKPVSVRAAMALKLGPASREESDRAGYADHVRKVHAAGAGKVVKGRVVCYGDSLTGATNYRHYVASALGNYEVIAKGYPAMRTSFGKQHVERHMKQYNPEFCLILYGTNNSKGTRNIPPAMADLLFIVKACEKNGTVPVIGTIPPRGFRDPESKPEKGFNAELVKMCRKNKIPVAYIFEAYQESGVDRKKLLSGDGVHTISGGWVCMGQAWRAAMEQVRFAVLDRP